MKYVYSFYAESIPNLTGRYQSNDGIVIRDGPLIDVENWNALKRDIADNIAVDHDLLIIKSLVFLHVI
jgi:hypothetical protein